MTSTMDETSVRLLLTCDRCRRQFDATGVAAGSRFHCSCGEALTVPSAEGAHEAAVVRCSSCSAPRSGAADRCSHCGADFTIHDRDLHTICGGCMTRVSDRARYCHHCAAPIAPQGKIGEATRHACPSCGPRRKLVSRALGDPPQPVLECGGCAGLWVGEAVFRGLAERARDQGLTEVGFGSGEAPREAAGKAALYRRCPMCDKHMNRRNYAKRSGVILDECREHGLWFDATELGRVLQFIRDGGERRSRARDEAEKRERRRAAGIKNPVLERSIGAESGPRWGEEADAFGSLGSILGMLFDR